MMISSHIRNAANPTIANDSWQSYFKKIEIFFSRKQQGTIRTDWKICFCIFYHLCIMVTIFQVANSISIFQQQYPSTIQKTDKKWSYIINQSIMWSQKNHVTKRWFSNYFWFHPPVLQDAFTRWINNKLKQYMVNNKLK